MRFQIVTKLRGSRDTSWSEKFECPDLLAASQYHGEVWNARFAWTDRYRSTIYLLSDISPQRQKLETINW
jgi:hypothetical protein